MHTKVEEREKTNYELYAYFVRSFARSTISIYIYSFLCVSRENPIIYLHILCVYVCLCCYIASLSPFLWPFDNEDNENED